MSPRELIMATIRRRSLPATTKVQFAHNRVAVVTFPADLTASEAEQLGQVLAALATDGSRLEPGQSLELEVVEGPVQ